MSDVPRRVALITGARSEIAGAVAETLARLGYTLALTGRDEAKLAALAARCQAVGVETLVLPADLGDRQTHEALVEQTVGGLGGLDVLVNTAGAFDWASAAAADLERWDELLDVNLRAAMRLTRLALPHLTRSDLRGVAGRALRLRHERGVRRLEARPGGVRRVGVRGRARRGRQGLRDPPGVRQRRGEPHDGGF